MNNDQIQKFINASKSAGFEVVETEWHDAFQTRIQLTGDTKIQYTEYSNGDRTFNLCVEVYQ